MSRISLRSKYDWPPTSVYGMRRRRSFSSKGRAWCAERLADYKVPETVTLSAEPLPRNPNGKLLKRVLRETLGAA